jgi:DNA repair exonuclease SbcCD ATPase subunit
VKQLEELGDGGDSKTLRKRIKEIREELDVLEAEDKRLEKVRDKHDAANRELENLDDHVDPDLRKFLTQCNKEKVDPMEALKEEYSTAKTTMKLADLLHDHDDGACPTCMQKINIKDLERTIAQAKKRKGKAHSMIHALELRITKQENTEIIKALKFDERAFYGARKKIKALRAELEKLEDLRENAVRFDEITKQMSELEKPKQPKRQPVVSLEKIEQQLEMLDEVKRLKARLAEFDEVPADDNILKRLAEVEAKLEKVEKKYSKAHKITVRYSSLRAEWKLLKKQREEASLKVEEYKPLIRKLKRFKILAKAYSNKGLKLHAMHEIVYGLEQNYNKYAQLIFAENFQFKVEAKEDGVHITVDRGQGNVSDVRELSGAESDSFRLLHFLACVIMAKDSRRVNLAILDEPDAHMDLATTGLFVERYVPFLRKLVQHVFIITQKGKHLHPECSYVTVEKYKGVSNVRYDA